VKSKTSSAASIMASSDGWVSGFRIVAPRWTASAFSGEGAAKFGGRWNSPGRRVIYLAGSRALAALEMLVHLTSPGSRAKPYQMFEVLIPRDHIHDAAAGADTAGIGDAWLASGKSLALRVPSILIPAESNYLLDPAHPGIDRVRIGEPWEFHFDPRL